MIQVQPSALLFILGVLALVLAVALAVIGFVKRNDYK